MKIIDAFRHNGPMLALLFRRARRLLMGMCVCRELRDVLPRNTASVILAPAPQSPPLLHLAVTKGHTLRYDSGALETYRLVQRMLPRFADVALFLHIEPTALFYYHREKYNELVMGVLAVLDAQVLWNLRGLRLAAYMRDVESVINGLKAAHRSLQLVDFDLSACADEQVLQILRYDYARYHADKLHTVKIAGPHKFSFEISCAAAWCAQKLLRTCPALRVLHLQSCSLENVDLLTIGNALLDCRSPSARVDLCVRGNPKVTTTRELLRALPCLSALRPYLAKSARDVEALLERLPAASLPIALEVHLARALAEHEATVALCDPPRDGLELVVELV